MLSLREFRRPILSGLVAWLVYVYLLVCLLFFFLIDLISGCVFLTILFPAHHVFYQFVFLEGRLLMDLVFGGLWSAHSAGPSLIFEGLMV